MFDHVESRRGFLANAAKLAALRTHPEAPGQLVLIAYQASQALLARRNQVQQPTIPLVSPKATPRPETKPTVYVGRIPDLYGKRYVEPVRMRNAMEALKTAGSPVLTLAHSQINTLTTSRVRPAEFPRWVDPNGFPIPVTTDNSDTSLAALGMNWKEPQENNFLVSTRPTKPFWMLEPDVLMGLNLGSTFASYQAISEGLLLVKEIFTGMLTIKIAQEYYKYQQSRGATFRKLNGMALKPDEQELAGASLLFQELQDHTSDIWKVIDAAPVLFVAAAIPDLIKAGKLPESTKEHTVFYRATNQIRRSPAVFNPIAMIVQKWINLQTLLPQDGITNEVFSGPLASEARLLASTP